VYGKSSNYHIHQELFNKKDHFMPRQNGNWATMRLLSYEYHPFISDYDNNDKCPFKILTGNEIDKGSRGEAAKVDSGIFRHPPFGSPVDVAGQYVSFGWLAIPPAESLTGKCSSVLVLQIHHTYLLGWRTAACFCRSAGRRGRRLPTTMAILV
jgi:hypothetical protein